MSKREVDIDYTPHFHALTKTGSSHFQRIADATAEFIDNSIQACKNNIPDENRVIDVGVYLKTVKSSRRSEGYAVIIDNGKGMNERDLREFATYSLDQETRGNRPSERQGDSFISKFGVGAKQAGFFLGMTLFNFFDFKY